MMLGLKRFTTTNGLVYLGISFSMICWAFSFVWYKLALEYMQPLTLVLFRLMISSVFLFPFAFMLGKLQKIKRSDYRIFLLLAFFEPLLYFLGEVNGVQRVSSTLAAVIISTIPLFSPFVAWLFSGDRISPLNFAGIVISVAGVALVVDHPGFSWSGSITGILLLLLAVASALGYSVVIARISKRYNSITITAVQNLIGVVYFLPLFFQFEYADFHQVNFTPDLIRPLVYLSVFASSLAFVTFVYGVQKLGITRSNIFVNLIPVFTAVFAWFILKDPLYLSNMLGILIVVAGLFLSQSGGSWLGRFRRSSAR